MMLKGNYKFDLSIDFNIKSVRLSKLGYGFFLFFIAFAIGCVSFDEAFRENPDFSHKTRSYPLEFNKVWKALQITMLSYSLAVNDIEKGLIETKVTEKSPYWLPMYNERSQSLKRLKYRIKIQVIGGKGEEDDDARNWESQEAKGENSKKRTKLDEEKNHFRTQVVISKIIKVKRNFFSEIKSLDSDGLEEEIILYRIQRELELEKALQEEFSY